MDFALRRRLMIDRQLRGRGIRDERVLRAMLEIPRELFVPENRREDSYLDEPLPIGFGQTISQPYMTAFMVECLELKSTDLVLEVGAGSGYHAAVLGALAGRVITIEIVPELAEMARANLALAGRDANIAVIAGDGSLGHPDAAPYDAISVAAAAGVIPAALIAQLKDPGRMAIPVGSWDQELRLVRKNRGEVHSSVAAYCRFVPLREPAATQQ